MTKSNRSSDSGGEGGRCRRSCHAGAVSSIGRPWRSCQAGLREGEKNMSIVNQGPVNIVHPVVALNISQTYKVGMSPKCLQECARGVWRLSPSHAERAEYIFAVYEGEILEVYKASRWDDADTTPYTFRTFTPDELLGRYEFVGVPAPPAIRKVYVGRQLGVPFGQNPVRYFDC